MFTSAAHPFESTVGTLHSFNIMLLPAQTTPMTLLYAGELMKETNLKLQVFHNGLQQASRQCRHREVPITTVSVPSHPTSIVSYSCVNCYTCPYDNSWLKKFLHSAHLAEVSLSLLHCFCLLSNSNWYGVVCVCVCKCGACVEEGSGE